MRHLLLLVALVVSAPFVDAQITYLPNTGCPRSGKTMTGGSTGIGGKLFISSSQLPCNSIGTRGFILLGTACTTLPPLSVGCFSNPCVLLQPDIVLSKPISYHLTIDIPNNKSLVGIAFCAQGGCLSTFGGACMAPLGEIARIQIQL